MKKSHNRPSKLAPVFMASAVVFLLGSAYRFIFGHKDEESQAESDALIDKDELAQTEALDEEEDEDHPKEPEEDPIQSL